MDTREIDEIFLAEANRRLAEVGEILQGAFPRPASPAFLTLQRHAHSLKGAAGSLEHADVEALAAEIWEQLDSERRGSLAPGEVEDEVRREFSLLREAIGRLSATPQPK